MAFGQLHTGFFDELRATPEVYVDGILKHIGDSTPWAVSETFLKKERFFHEQSRQA